MCFVRIGLPTGTLQQVVMVSGKGSKRSVALTDGLSQWGLNEADHEGRTAN
jgi:hypothetical protein